MVCPRWEVLRALADAHGVTFPEAAPERLAVAVWTRSHNIVGGVGLVEHGPLLMFEWLVLNESEPEFLRHAALEALMLAGREYAAKVGKRPVMVVDRRRGGLGIRNMAERLGFAFRNEHLEVLEGK